jgi:hypothetical protein
MRLIHLFFLSLILSLTALLPAFAGFQTSSTALTWSSCTITWTATTTSPTLGTITSEKCSYYVAGKVLHAHYSLNVTNTNAVAGSGTYLMSIPGGGTVDTTKITADTGCDLGSVGFVQINQGGTFGQGHVCVYDSTHLGLKITAANDVPSAMAHGYFGFGDAKKMTFNIDIPIQ